MLLRKVIDPDGTINWFGNDREAVQRAAVGGGKILCFDVKGADNIARLLNAERDVALQIDVEPPTKTATPEGM